MSAVFGFAKVVKVIPLAEKRFATVVLDEELNDKQVVIFSQLLPVGKMLYYEFDCRTKKTHWLCDM